MSAPDSDLMSYAVKMVIPIKREFGRSVDVHHLLNNLAYAKEVIDLALTSRDERLTSYAEYMQSKLFGPRGTHLGRATPSVDPASTSLQSPPRDPDSEEIINKYKMRLR